MKKSNKFFAILILVILAIPMFNSCKKGADDPFISLRSRSGRLKGIWNLTSGTETYTSGSSTYTETYTESMVTVSYSGASQTYTHTESIEFDKANAFKSTVMHDGSITTCDGFWAFMDGYGDVKNSECVVIRLSSQTSGGTITTYTGDDMPSYILRFDKLSGSEAIIQATGTTVGSSTDTDTSNKTYTKK